MKRFKSPITIFVCCIYFVVHANAGSSSSSSSSNSNNGQQTNSSGFGGSSSSSSSSSSNSSSSSSGGQNTQTSNFSSASTSNGPQRKVEIKEDNTNTIKQSSDESESGNNTAMIAALVMGGLMTTQSYDKYMQYSKSGGEDYVSLAFAILYGLMAVLSFMQADEHDDKKKDSGNTAGKFNGLGGADNLYSDKGYNDGKTLETAAEKVVADLNKKGVPAKFDKKTGKLSIAGKSAGTGDVSPAGMAAMGLSPDQIAQVNSTVAKANAQALAKAKLTVPDFGEEGGGGGKGKGGTTMAAVDPSLTNSGTQARGIAALDSKGAAAGLTKTYRGEPIGVANDSIFLMMTRRYQLKDRQNGFFMGNELVLQK